MDFVLTQNADVWVRTIDVNGIATVHSERVDVFDNEPPVVSVVQNGRVVNVVAFDSLSGVAQMYVNGILVDGDRHTVSVDEFTRRVSAKQETGRGTGQR